MNIYPLLQVHGWAQAMPKFAGDLVKFVQTFLERTYERCRTSYMEAWSIYYNNIFSYSLEASLVLFASSQSIIIMSKSYALSISSCFVNTVAEFH
jgi:hypothetical protein